MKTGQLRMSVTELEGLRYCLQSDYVSWNEVRDRLQRKRSQQTDKQLIGIAFHKAMENLINMVPTSHNSVKKDDYTFDFRALRGVSISAPQVCEVKIVRNMGLYDGVNVDLVGVADGIKGNEVIDHKLTFAPFSAESYAESLQWVCYLVLFKKQVFRYIVYEAKEDLKVNNLIVIKNVNQFVIHRPEGLEDCLDEAISTYVYYIKKYAPERICEESYHA